MNSAPVLNIGSTGEGWHFGRTSTAVWHGDGRGAKGKARGPARRLPQLSTAPVVGRSGLIPGGEKWLEGGVLRRLGCRKCGKRRIMKKPRFLA